MARPREFDEEDVLSAVTDAFWTSGYAGTSVDDILRATGLTKGSIYNSFGGKWSLFSRAFDDYCSRSVAQFSDRMKDPEASAATRLIRLFEPEGSMASSPPPKYPDTSRDHGADPQNADPPRACLLAKSTAELAATHPHVASRSRETFQQLLAVLADTVRDAQLDGDVHPDVEPHEAAALLLTTLRGIEALREAKMPHATTTQAGRLALRAIGLGPTGGIPRSAEPER